MQKTEKQMQKRKFFTFNFQLSTLLLLAAMLITSCGNSSGNKQEANSSVNENEEVATKQEDAVRKKLPFKRGSYVEVTNAMGMEITKTIYFDHWGDWTASEDKSEMTIMGHTYKTDKLEIVKGKTHWQLDLIEKTGKRYELNFEAPDMATALTAAIGGQMTEGMEIKELGEESYLGYTCKKMYIKYPQMQMEATILSYNNLTMKMEGKMGEKMNVSTVITSIDLSAPPASIFEVPDGIEVEIENY